MINVYHFVNNNNFELDLKQTYYRYQYYVDSGLSNFVIRQTAILLNTKFVSKWNFNSN